MFLRQHQAKRPSNLADNYEIWLLPLAKLASPTLANNHGEARCFSVPQPHVLAAETTITQNPAYTLFVH